MPLLGEKKSNIHYIESDHVVVWSGGCDSTLLLKEVAEEYGTINSPVAAVSINHFLLDERKNEIEALKREKLLTELTDRGLNIIHRTFTVAGEANMLTKTENTLQPYLWLNTLLPYIKEEAKLYFGFIRSDDTTMRLDRIRKLCDGICEYLNKSIALETPYIYKKKEDILRELMNIDLYDKVWYCEIPNKGDMNPCTRCQPCKTHQEALLHMAVNGDERAIKLLPKHVKIVKKHLPKGRRLTW